MATRERALTGSQKATLRALTARQKQTLKRHSAHHSDKHMSEMRKAMREGKTFGQAHKSAMRKVGK